MDIYHSIILGFVQGATEFLPISSTGHLILFRDFLNIKDTEGLAFDAVLQLGTAISIIFYFKNSLFDEIKKNFLNIFIGSIPIVITGFVFEKYIADYLRSPFIVALGMIIGSFVMFLATRTKNYLENESSENSIKLSTMDSIKIGLYQTLALFPGMSRSGMTISGGIFHGLNNANSAKYSFLLAIPILLGTGLKKAWDLYRFEPSVFFNNSLWVGFFVSFIVGLFSIKILINLVKKVGLKPFVYYRLSVASIIILYYFIKL